MQLASSRNIDQQYYYRNWPVHASLNKTTKNFKIEEPKPKAHESKALNNFLHPNQGVNAKTFDKAWKKKKKHWRWEKQIKNSNAGTSSTLTSRVNITNNPKGSK